MSQTPPPPPPPPAYAGAAVGDRGPVPPSLDSVFYKTGLNILLAIVTFGVWMFIWSYRTGEDLKSHNREGIGGVLYCVILFFISPVVMFLMPNEVEKMYQRDGRQSPVSTLLGLWFLLPIIGNIIWYVKMQNALNDYWLSKGSRPA